MSILVIEMFTSLQLPHSVTITEFDAIQVKQYSIIMITFHNQLNVKQMNDHDVYNNMTQVNKLCENKDCFKLS
jgi:hypothetical protein